MKYIDIILALPLLWGIFIGFKKGLILELATLVALILGVFGAIKFSDVTAEYLVQHVDIPQNYLGLSSFLVTFLLIVIVVFIIGKVLDKLIKVVALGIVNRALGALFGLCKYALIISYLLYFVENLNAKFHFYQEDIKSESLLYEPLILLTKPMSHILESFEIKELENLPDVNLELP